MILDFVCSMLGVDLTVNPELHFHMVTVSSALLIIMFSSVYSLLFFIGGIASGRR